jgi:hypothetical protein
MDSILTRAYVERPCNHCGGTLRVSLYDVLSEYRLSAEVNAARPCSSCSVENTFLLGHLPEDALTQIQAAWEILAEAAEGSGIEIQLERI